MEITTLSPEKVAELIAPLPAGAVKPHPTKNFLSTINPAFVIERLNNVFGFGGWKMTYEIIERNEKWVVVKATFTAPAYPHIHIENFGGNDNADPGDAYKGACTDALTKIASYLGIGAEVWKDDRKDKKQPQKPANTPPAQPVPITLEKFKAMKVAIEEGKGQQVLEKMKDYTIPDDWRKELTDLILKK